MTDFRYSNNFEAQSDEFENDEDAEYLDEQLEEGVL